MPRIPNVAQTEGSATFDPDKFFAAWEKEEVTAPYDNDFRKFIIRAFGLKPTDTYVYTAVAEVSLLQAQTYLEFGGQGGLHGWYKDTDGNLLPPPSATDIAAYSTIFSSTTSTAKSLVGLASNAKKGSLRASIAAHLQSLYAPPPAARKLVVPKLKKAHTNPYYDVWSWTNQNLEWGGPEPGTAQVRISHALLPVLYHHFGCVVPSYEALCLIAQLAAGRTVLDLGSGNGYWTYMLRRFAAVKPVKVVPVDNGLSEWRTVWVPDTVTSDGVQYLAKNGDGKDLVLLLVYPQVGADFTGKVLRSYKGDTVVCAGTQNANGFTAFAKETIADWMAREMPEFVKTCQVPLPSFAGKDEALFVFEKKAAGPA
ncbi:hypothetical protein MBLNU459_g7662t1 [Dothideomycetes sp. NU459]